LIVYILNPFGHQHIIHTAMRINALAFSKSLSSNTHTELQFLPSMRATDVLGDVLDFPQFLYLIYAG